jgi:hypothetical protein
MPLPAVGIVGEFSGAWGTGRSSTIMAGTVASGDFSDEHSVMCPWLTTFSTRWYLFRETSIMSFDKFANLFLIAVLLLGSLPRAGAR